MAERSGGVSRSRVDTQQPGDVRAACFGTTVMMKLVWCAWLLCEPTGHTSRAVTNVGRRADDGGVPSVYQTHTISTASYSSLCSHVPKRAESRATQGLDARPTRFYSGCFTGIV